MSQSGILRVSSGSGPPGSINFITDSGTAAPLGNDLHVNGIVVAADSIPFRFTAPGNTNIVRGEIQISQAFNTSNVNKIGLSSFDSNSFNVDVNGFVTIKGLILINGPTVDMTQTGLSTIFTLPVKFIVTELVFSVISLTGVPGSPTASFGTNNPTYDDYSTGQVSFSVLSQDISFIKSSDPFQVPAGIPLVFNVGTADISATTYTLRIDALGYYF